MFLPSCFRVSEVILNVWGEFISHCPGLADRITLDSSRHSLDELDDSARGSLVVRYFRVPLFQIRDISSFSSCLTMMCSWSWKLHFCQFENCPLRAFHSWWKELSKRSHYYNCTEMRIRWSGYLDLVFYFSRSWTQPTLTLGEDEDKIVWQIQYRILDKDEDESK